MKTTYPFVAAALAAGLLASCVAPYAGETGGTALRTSGAYSSQHRGAGSTYFSRDLRDPTGDWRHDDEDFHDADEDYDDDDGDDRYVRGRSIPRTSDGDPDPRYVSYHAWRPGMGPGELPAGARRVMVNGRLYYNRGNVWYRPTATGFVVVNSPYAYAY